MNSDHLANERTFLAYLRTALAFIAFGFVIARFSLFAREFSAIAHVRAPDVHLSTQLGVAMAVAGMLTAVFGAYRYASMRRAIDGRQTRPMATAWATAAAIAVTAVAISVSFALFAYR